MCNAEVDPRVPPPPPAAKKKLVRTYRVVVEIDINFDGDNCAIEGVRFVKAVNIRNVTTEEKNG